MRVLADGQIYRQTDAKRFYNLSHAICYSYGQIIIIIIIPLRATNALSGSNCHYIGPNQTVKQKVMFSVVS